MGTNFFQYPPGTKKSKKLSGFSTQSRDRDVLIYIQGTHLALYLPCVFQVLVTDITSDRLAPNETTSCKLNESFV